MHRFPSPRSALLLVGAILLWSPVTADPQTNLLNAGCSQYNVTNPSTFAATLNATFADIRSVLSDARFATAERPRGPDPAYALFQCRSNLSGSDCIACLSVAEARIRRCSTANGACVIYDGCTLRYERVAFFDIAAAGSAGVCGNATTSAIGFPDAVKLVLSDLSTATPRIEGFFAAVARDGVFAVAQCVNTATEQGCADCLAVGETNIVSCPPAADGRALDAVCFMRYSDKSFFPANQTVDLSPFFTSGKSSKKRALIGGVVGGVIGVVLLVGLIALLLIKKSRDGQSLRKGQFHLLRLPISARQH